MLKSIVNGAEHDIIKIPMKGKNLFSQNSISGKTTVVRDTFNEIGNSIVFNSGQYIISMNVSTESTAGIFKICFTYTDESQDKSVWLTNRTQSVVLVSNSAKVVKSISITDYNMYVDVTLSNIMLNTGSTALPYEPYGYQNGWEIRDNQNRLIWGREDELQTTTGTLPFKGYDLPIKVKSLLGNSVQNGTPSPSPINPNLVDPSKTVPGYQQSNGTIHEPSSGNERTTDWIPFTTDNLYAIVSGSNNGNINWVLYDSNKQPLYFYGPTFSPNTVIIISRSGYSAAAFIRISWTNAINQPICVTTEQRSEYIAFDPNPSGPVIPEMCGVKTENLIDKTEFAGVGATIEQIEDGVRIITQSNGYAAKITLNVLSNTDYYISYVFKNITSGTNRVRVFAGTGTTTEIASFSSSGGTFNTGNNTKINIWFYAAFGSSATVEYTNIMLNTGSTAIPYEPYGYKISLDNNGENLFDSTNITHEALDSSGFIRYESAMNLSGFIAVDGDYTVSWKATGTGAYMRVSTFDENKNFIERVTELNTYKHTYYSNSHTGYIRINYESTYGLSDIMLNSGSTPLSYSPYLNKTTPIYLSEVPTIRRIKKLVLTGTESTWSKDGSSGGVNRYRVKLSDAAETSVGYSDQFYISHYGRQNTGYYVVNKSFLYVGSGVWCYICADSAIYPTVDDYKTFLAQQYQNGTPVTIWYVLATPQTAIINEPLARIGDYTDELTEISVHNLSAPLYGIGDYKDILNLSTGVVTRKVKKLVLDGTETIGLYEGRFYIQLPTDAKKESIAAKSTHFYGTKTVPIDDLCCRQMTTGYWGGQLAAIQLRYDSKTSSGLMQDYLRQQYQAGTPITIWYVLETPTTETITVPTGMTGEIEGYLTQISTPTPEHPSIPKWNGKEETGGTYAVTVYNLPEIPTTTGKNTLTVETEKIHGLTNPLCGVGDYKDVLNLSTGVITRKVKKLVLTGEETIGSYESNFYIQLPSDAKYESNAPICTHFLGSKITPLDNYCIRQMVTGYWGGQLPALQLKDRSHGSVLNLKDFFAAQYQNGTPVIVWYVLSTSEIETITVPYGLECSVEGYLTQSGTPTPSNPITPESNGILESGGTYAVEVSLDPSNLTVKGHIKPVQ